MTDIRRLCYSGTGVFHLPLLDRLAQIYYSPMADRHDVVMLDRGGLAHPRLRHANTALIAHLKETRHGQHSDVVIGHSQGALEALEEAIDSADARVAILACGPFGGSDLAPAWAPNSGVRAMARGSRYLRELRERTNAMLESRTSPPHLYLIGAHHDGVVDCDSAFAVSPDYPVELVHRYCVSYNNPGHDFAQWVQVPFGMDNHFTVIWAGAVRALVRDIVKQHDQSSLQAA